MKNNTAKANWNLGKLAGGVLFVALFCLASLLASSNVSARPNGRDRYQVLGTIENVDRAANTITVRLSDGRDKTLQLGKRLTINGREETRGRAEAALTAQERAVIYFTEKGGEETGVDVESFHHAMRRTVTGELVSVDKDNKVLVLKTNGGTEERFRVQNDAVIETQDGVMTFAQLEPQTGTQITLHYEDPMGLVRVSRLKR